MTFPLYLYLALAVLSPWPIFYSFMFYFSYQSNRNFEYYISTPKELYKIWIKVLFLPVIIFSIFMLRYSRIGISLDLYKLSDMLWEIIYPLDYYDIIIFGLFICLFLITWILAMRLFYQRFRKLILALYLYYYQYAKFREYCTKILIFSVYYDNYLWARVNIFASNLKAFTITWFIWPTCINILERNFFLFILPYLIIFDTLIDNGVLTKIFIILPWYYIYSLLKMGLKFFFSIHRFENWQNSEKMYGYSPE